MGIYNRDYHDEYRNYIHSGRYSTYIRLVGNDIKENIERANTKIIDLMNKKFPKPEFEIEGLNCLKD